MTASVHPFENTNPEGYFKGYILNISDHLLFGDLHHLTVKKVLETHPDLAFMRFRVWSSKFQLHETVPSGKAQASPKGLVEVDVLVDHSLLTQDGEISDFTPVAKSVTTSLLQCLKKHCYVH